MDFFGGGRGGRAKPPARGGRPAVVTTTSRTVAARPRTAPRPPADGAARHNALPEAVKQRLAGERERAAAADRARQDEAQRAAKRARTAARARAEAPGDRETESSASASPAPADASKFQHNVPRDILWDASYSPLPEDITSHDQGSVASAELVRTSTSQYSPCLGENPVVTLEYPGPDAREDFLLLVPHDTDEYDPISDLLRAVRAMVACYVPADRRATFGELDSLETGSSAGAPLRAETHRSSPAAQNTPPPAEDADPILRSLTKARNRRHGPLFARAVERFNQELRTLKADGTLNSALRTLGDADGVPEMVWRTAQEQVYARVVGPEVDKLKRYEAFSDYVYGELQPPFLSEISRRTRLGPNSVFVDLGSGIGNLLLQASLQSGAEVYGCEVMPVPSSMAERQLLQAVHRWRMWNVRGGRHMEAWCADFTDSERVRSVLKRADVVLVNNYAFRPHTNDTLSLLFLDLKDGATVVSLRPFVPHDFRLTERTLSSPLAILRMEEHKYTSGCVSWAAGGGKYYVHTLDRSLVQRYLERH